MFNPGHEGPTSCRVAPTPPWKILVILKTLITLVQVCLIEIGTKLCRTVTLRSRIRNPYVKGSFKNKRKNQFIIKIAVGMYALFVHYDKQQTDYMKQKGQKLLSTLQIRNGREALYHPQLNINNTMYDHLLHSGLSLST